MKIKTVNLGINIGITRVRTHSFGAVNHNKCTCADINSEYFYTVHRYNTLKRNKFLNC